ncbi:hypothetical protein D1007_34702 [Hordeum vulgare]|nr:hypothetical protein D1007_34702 [Hordeum vulgare]
MYTYHFSFLLLASTATLSAAFTASPYSSACPSLSPAHDRHTDGDDAVSLIRSFRITAGQFSGGADGLFSPDDDPYDRRPFHFFPHRASRTVEPALVHLTATLTLTGPRSWRSGGRHYYSEAASIAFVLDGYHSSASLELCMVGTGTEHAADGSLKLYPDVVLRLHVPSPPSLADPFVSGGMEGSPDLGTIRLLAYAEGDHYNYDSELWTMRDRSVVAGMLWNSSRHAGAEAEPIHGVITERSTTNDLSDVKYNYNDTILEEAKKHHRELISKGKKMRGTHSFFPDFNSTDGDSEFIFHGLDISSGRAYPVTIGSAVVAHNILAADDFFSQHQQWNLYGSRRAATADAISQRAVVDDMKAAELLNVSYVIRYSIPRDENPVRPSNVTYYSSYS